VLWTQTAAEHHAACLQAYRHAQDLLDRALKDKRWTAATEQTGEFGKLPPAVILDIDETVVDNSPMQARAAHANADFNPQLWEAWVSESSALPLPGALEFTQYARSRGVTVFFVSNRDAKLEAATRRNLTRLNFPLEAAKGPATDTVLLRGEQPEWGSDKGTRRAAVAKSYRILLLIGDDFGDFLSNVRTSIEQRQQFMTTHRDKWGTRWIVLPNPMYGSWEMALYDHKPAEAREANIDTKFRRLQTAGMKPE
jgi:acid phosphatase